MSHWHLRQTEIRALPRSRTIHLLPYRRLRRNYYQSSAEPSRALSVVENSLKRYKDDDNDCCDYVCWSFAFCSGGEKQQVDFSCATEMSELIQLRIGEFQYVQFKPYVAFFWPINRFIVRLADNGFQLRLSEDTTVYEKTNKLEDKQKEIFVSLEI